MAKSTFNVKVTLDEAYIHHFLGFLQRLQKDGVTKDKEWVGFYADGSKAFEPVFEIDDGLKFTLDQIDLIDPTFDHETRRSFAGYRAIRNNKSN